MSTLFKTAQRYIPSGVNSPVRAFRAVGGDPVFIKKGKGPHLWDEKGRRYLDFCASWGPLLFGHAPEGLIKVLHREIKKGTSFGAATKKEVELAQLICKRVPSVEKVRLVSSGTEAVMSALRLARGATGRKKIVKVEGGYHGHVDSLLVKAGSGAATFGVPDSAGIPEELARLTLTIPFNDPAALQDVFDRHGRDIAAFIVEPVPANMGVVLPQEGYLELARSVTKQYGALLIFDEVITGFRLGPGGAQEYFGVMPDLTTMGKILGGGFPLAAFGGRKEFMDRLVPGGTVYQAGTLSGNPVAVSAALWVLGRLKPPFYKRLHHKAGAFFKKLRAEIQRVEAPVTVNTMGSMFTIFFSAHPVTDDAGAKTCDTRRFARFHQACRRSALYLAPSQFEANFISSAHTPAQLADAARRIAKALL